MAITERSPQVIDQPEIGMRLERFIGEEHHAEVIRHVAKQIYEKHGTNEVVLVGVLMGADTVTVELAEELARLGNLKVLKAYIAIRSYNHNKSNEAPEVYARVVKFPLEGKNVILVDAIAETQWTAVTGKRYLSLDKPATLETCAIYIKDGKNKVEANFDYIGIKIPGELWYGGKGPDGIDERYRHLPGIFAFYSLPPKET